MFENVFIVHLLIYILPSSRTCKCVMFIVVYQWFFRFGLHLYYSFQLNTKYMQSVYIYQNL